MSLAGELETVHEAFNLALPERHGYIDYDLVYLLGRRLEGPRAIARP